MGKGKFAAAKPVLRPDGKPLSEENAQSPCLSDWDGDGDYDMAVGFINGPVKLYANNGKFQFKEQGVFRADGQTINASDGGPCMVDWDGDGKLDLLMGDGEGRVIFYPGTKRGSRELGKGQTILGENGAMGAWDERKPDPRSPVGFSPATPGARTKPYAADWNGDGKLDLLVGDYIMLLEKQKILTSAEKAELARLEKAQMLSVSKMGTASQKVYEVAYKKIGKKRTDRLTQADSKAFLKAYQQAVNQDKEYQRMQKEYADLYERIRKLKPAQNGTGLVWVYLRK